MSDDNQDKEKENPDLDQGSILGKKLND